MIRILLFYFVAVCHPDTDLCERLTEAPRWPGAVRVEAAYDVEGPFFTLEDCQDGRQIKGYATVETPFGVMVTTPWGVPGMSQCYAREVFLLH